MEKTIIILRSVSGAGKSTFTKKLCKNGGIVECNADKFFEDENGIYTFDVTRLGSAHKSCQASFMKALHDNVTHTIIVSNTNTKESDWSFYVREGEKVGASFIFLVVENRHESKDIHNVPRDILNQQEVNIRNSLKLR